MPPPPNRTLLTLRPHRVALLWAAALWLAAPAFAQESPSPAPVPACTSAALLNTSDPDALALHLERCYQHPAYLARLGHLYLQQQRYAHAIDPLERALLFEPNNPDTQLDYALALAGNGDAASALNLVLALQQDPTLPASLRQSLGQTLQATLAPAVRTQPGQATRFSASLRTGYDSNLLGAPRLSSIALTLPTETLILPLDASSLPRAGWFARSDVRLHHVRQQANGSRWELQAAALQRNSPSLNAANSTQAELQLEHSRPGHYASATAATLQSHAGTRYTSQGISAGLEQPPSATQPCTLRLGLEWQNRQLHSNPILSGHYLGTSGQWTCPATKGRPLQWQLGLRAGQDRPQAPTRPGGTQHQYGLRAHASAASSSTTTWLLDAEASHHRDATGYSPLLANHRRRTISRFTLRAEVQHALTPGLTALAGLEAVAQSASLPLFAVHSRGLYAGLRVQW